MNKELEAVKRERDFLQEGWTQMWGFINARDLEAEYEEWCDEQRMINRGSEEQ